MEDSDSDECFHRLFREEDDEEQDLSEEEESTEEHEDPLKAYGREPVEYQEDDYYNDYQVHDCSCVQHPISGEVFPCWYHAHFAKHERQPPN